MAARTPDSKLRLGRGLSSLISAPTPPAEPEGRVFFECDIEAIDPMVGQPRRRFKDDALAELAASIRESGVLQPLVVRQGDGGRYSLVAGERRLRAAKIVGLKRVPVVVRELTDTDAFAVALIENIQRADLDPIEEALAYRRLLDEYGFTQDQLAQRVGKSRPALTNSLRLLKLSEGIKVLVGDGSLSAGHARAILSVPDDLQDAFAERVTSDELSVRQAELMARELRGETPPVVDEPPTATSDETPTPPEAAAPRPATRPQSTAVKAAQRRLMERFGAKVVIQQRTSGAGSIEIHFADDEALKGLVDLLLPD